MPRTPGTLRCRPPEPRRRRRSRPGRPALVVEPGPGLTIDSGPRDIERPAGDVAAGASGIGRLAPVALVLLLPHGEPLGQLAVNDRRSRPRTQATTSRADSDQGGHRPADDRPDQQRDARTPSRRAPRARRRMTRSRAGTATRRSAAGRRRTSIPRPRRRTSPSEAHARPSGAPARAASDERRPCSDQASDVVRSSSSRATTGTAQQQTRDRADERQRQSGRSGPRRPGDAPERAASPRRTRAWRSCRPRRAASTTHRCPGGDVTGDHERADGDEPHQQRRPRPPRSGASSR